MLRGDRGPSEDEYRSRFLAFMNGIRRNAWIISLVSTMGILIWMPLMKEVTLGSVLIVAVPSYLIFFALFRTAPRWGMWSLGPRWNEPPG